MWKWLFQFQDGFLKDNRKTLDLDSPAVFIFRLRSSKRQKLHQYLSLQLHLLASADTHNCVSDFKLSSFEQYVSIVKTFVKNHDYYNPSQSITYYITLSFFFFLSCLVFLFIRTVLGHWRFLSEWETWLIWECVRVCECMRTCVSVYKIMLHCFSSQIKCQ